MDDAVGLAAAPELVLVLWAVAGDVADAFPKLSVSGLIQNILCESATTSFCASVCAWNTMRRSRARRADFRFAYRWKRSVALEREYACACTSTSEKRRKNNDRGKIIANAESEGVQCVKKSSRMSMRELEERRAAGSAWRRRGAQRFIYMSLQKQRRGTGAE